MGPSDGVILGLLELLYDAAASPELWPEFLKAFRAAGAADIAYLLAVGLENQADLSMQLGFEEASIARYGEYYVHRDPILDGYRQAMAEHGDWIGTHQSVIDDSMLYRSEVYHDFLKPIGMRHQCGATLSGLEPGTTAGFCLMRGDAAGEFDVGTVKLLAILAPHVRRAVSLHRKLESARAGGAVLRRASEMAGVAVVSLDGAGRVLTMTEAARLMVEAADGLTLEAGELRASSATERSRLGELIAGAVATGAGRGQVHAVRRGGGTAPQAGRTGVWTPAPGGAMLVSRRPPKRSLEAVVMPFHSSSWFLETSPCALVFLSDPQAAPAGRASVLRALYGLTPVEARLTDSLVAELDLSVAAECLGMSTHTARFHLKTIFRKTGTKRQSELVRLVLALPAV